MLRSLGLKAATWTFAILALAACASTPGRAFDEDSPAMRGRFYAQRHCSGCHNVNRQGVSTYRRAPPFRDFGAGATPALIRLFAAHPDGDDPYEMPRIILSQSDAEDLMAYIRTLKTTDRSAWLPPVPPCIATAQPC